MIMFVRVITLGVCGVVGGGLQKSYLVFIHNISGIKFVQKIGLFEDVFLVAGPPVVSRTLFSVVGASRIFPICH